MTETGTYDSGVRDAVEAGFAWQLRMSKPIIAAINGPVAGVGFVLALFCDLRFAVPGAKLTTSFGRLGLPAEYGSSWLLPRIVGRSRAADLLFSSRVVLAEEALAMGLVDRVCDLDETVAYARAVASEISPSSLTTIKRQLWDDLTRPLDASIAASTDLLHRMVGEPDFIEGVRALQEKRPPRF
jgi:enoyl-CoA hydratase/carnithine racemase